jgi:uncharacterized protein (TIGR03435 family)
MKKVALFPYKHWLTVAAIGIAVVSAPGLQGQQNAPEAKPSVESSQALAYEAVSIHKFVPTGGSMYMSVKNTPNGMIVTHQPVKSLLSNAYDVRYDQILGGPAWIDSDLYDVNAKMDEESMAKLQKLDPEKKDHARQQMLQAVLVERFKLKIHLETRQLPIYALVVAKGGVKLKESAPEVISADTTNEPDWKSGRGMMRMNYTVAGAYTINAIGVKIDALVGQLAGTLSAKVEDRTELKGKYDFELRYSNENEQAMAPSPSGTSSAALSDSTAPSLFEAIQEQLGLKLESRKGTVEVIVIDHIERPSEN